jgi:hypothetical protein
MMDEVIMGNNRATLRNDGIMARNLYRVMVIWTHTYIHIHLYLIWSI